MWFCIAAPWKTREEKNKRLERWKDKRKDVKKEKHEIWRRQKSLHKLPNELL